MSSASRLVLIAENAVPALPIACFDVFVVVAASWVAFYGKKDEIDDAGHAFSAM